MIYLILDTHSTRFQHDTEECSYVENIDFGSCSTDLVTYIRADMCSTVHIGIPNFFYLYVIIVMCVYKVAIVYIYCCWACCGCIAPAATC